MELSVVIAARNSTGDLPEQLDALLAQRWSGEWEVVVVDNGSTDRTAAVVEAYAARDPRVRLVSAPGGTGAGWVRNVGVSAARGSLLAMCDADDVVGGRWVSAIGDALRQQECVTGPLEVHRLNPLWLVRTRGVPSASQPMTFHDLFAIVPAGNLGVRRSTWERVGGFDPSVRTSEDAELSLRLFLAGVRVGFVPDAVVHYRYRQQARSLFRQGYRYGLGRPLVARRARDAGLRVPRGAGWRSWAALVAWLPRLRVQEGRAAWSWVAGVRAGTLVGSVRHRVVYL